MTKDTLLNIRTFLLRTELRGEEVPAFNAIIEELEALYYSLENPSSED